MSSKNEIIKSIIPPLSKMYGNPKKAKKYGLNIGKPLEIKQNIIKQEIAKTCFVSDSDGCIYKEGTREECESYISEERESGMLDFLPPLGIYTKEEWFYFFGAT